MGKEGRQRNVAQIKFKNRFFDLWLKGKLKMKREQKESNKYYFLLSTSFVKINKIKKR